MGFQPFLSHHPSLLPPSHSSHLARSTTDGGRRREKGGGGGEGHHFSSACDTDSPAHYLALPAKAPGLLEEAEEPTVDAVSDFSPASFFKGV